MTTTATKPRLKHGRYTTYTNHSCRCKKCTAAMTEYTAEYRATKKGRAVSRASNLRYRTRIRAAATWAYEQGYEDVE